MWNKIVSSSHPLIIFAKKTGLLLMFTNFYYSFLSQMFMTKFKTLMFFSLQLRLYKRLYCILNRSFPEIGLNTDIYTANFRTQLEYGKIRTRKTSEFVHVLKPIFFRTRTEYKNVLFRSLYSIYIWKNRDR